MRSALLLGSLCVTAFTLAQDRPVQVMDQANNSSVRVGVGQTLLVTLKVPAGTGYHWVVSKVDERDLRFNSSEVIAGMGSSLGNPNTQEFNFTALQQGTTDLTLAFYGPNDNKPSRLFRLRVRIGSNPEPGDLLAVFDKDNGSTIDVKAGQTVQVRLNSNPTTGYQWEYVSPPSSFVRLTQPMQYRPAREPMPGAGGVAVFTFAVSDIPFGSPRNQTLRFKYRRSFAPNDPGKDYSITLRISR